MKYKIIILTLICVNMLCACALKDKIGTTVPINTETFRAYPSGMAYPGIQAEIQNESAYPGYDQTVGESAYPVNSTVAGSSSGPKFEINEPLYTGSMEVTGTGPSNVPIILVDVTDVGVTLAKTTINSEGEFTFDLQTPLIKSHAVGLQIGDLSQTDFNYSDFTYGEDYLDRPLVGILFDMATIVDK